MQIMNSPHNYGIIHISLHWLIAIAIFGLFALGLWMVDLNFYSPWYHDAPNIHKSIGVLVMFAMALRWLWRLSQTIPPPLTTHSKTERVAASLAHQLMYVLVFSIGLSGYLISTAEGHPIPVFDWFELPASEPFIEHQADIAGEVHFWLASILIALVSLHAFGAIKHHLIDKDNTLKRMIFSQNHTNKSLND